MSDDPYTHVYHRIAETINRYNGWNVEASQVEVIITTPILPANDNSEVTQVIRAVWQEAEEYGMEKPNG